MGYKNAPLPKQGARLLVLIPPNTDSTAGDQFEESCYSLSNQNALNAEGTDRDRKMGK